MKGTTIQEKAISGSMAKDRSGHKMSTAMNPLAVVPNIKIKALTRAPHLKVQKIALR